MSSDLVVIIYVFIDYITKRRPLRRCSHVIAIHGHIRSLVRDILAFVLALNRHLRSLFRTSGRRRKLHYFDKRSLIVIIIVKPFIFKHFFRSRGLKFGLLTQLSKVDLRSLSTSVRTRSFSKSHHTVVHLFLVNQSSTVDSTVLVSFCLC